MLVKIKIMQVLSFVQTLYFPWQSGSVVSTLRVNQSLKAASDAATEGGNAFYALEFA